MLYHALLSLALSTAPSRPVGSTSLLTAVPAEAFALVQCHDLPALNERSMRNDWFRMLNSANGEDLYASLADGFLRATHTDFDDLLAIARNVRGEAVLFTGEGTAGFLTVPPPDRTALVEAMRAWLPDGEGESRRTVSLSGARVELAAWKGAPELGGWSGRDGHFAALVDHPELLGLFSGNSAEIVLQGVTSSLAGLKAGIEPALASGYREAGGGSGGGLELYVDFSPLAASADETLRGMVRDMVPDPARMLGLDRGTWLHATADVFPGKRIDCQARIHLPEDSVALELASTFRPLPHSLPAELPRGVQALWALRWDVAEFYSKTREALAAGGGEAGLQLVDQGLTAAEGMTGVDPVEDVIEQFEGTFAFYSLEGAAGDAGMAELSGLGFLAHLNDGEAFFEAFDQLVSGVGDAFELTEVEGFDAYLFPSDPSFDGGVAFLPKAFVVAPARATLLRALHALSGRDGASLVDGSPMQAAIDENAGATFLTVIDMTSYRELFLGAGQREEGEASEAGAEIIDPFDSQLVSSARRVADGFELSFATR